MHRQIKAIIRNYFEAPLPRRTHPCIKPPITDTSHPHCVHNIWVGTYEASVYFKPLAAIGDHWLFLHMALKEKFYRKSFL